MIYSQICVNFKITRKNGDERAKGEKTKRKGKVGTHQHSPKFAQARSSQRISPRRDHYNDVGFVFMQLAQASLIMPKREVVRISGLKQRG